MGIADIRRIISIRQLSLQVRRAETTSCSNNGKYGKYISNDLIKCLFTHQMSRIINLLILTNYLSLRHYYLYFLSLIDSFEIFYFAVLINNIIRIKLRLNEMAYSILNK